MASKKFRYEGSLVALVWHDSRAYYFARGDRARGRVPARAIEGPFLYLAPHEMSFSEQLRECQQLLPRGANAFAQRIDVRELVSSRPRHVAIQYFTISRRNWQRAYVLPQVDGFLRQECYPKLNL